VRDAPASLRHNRDFAILWSGDAVSGVGSSMSSLVFPLIGYAITHSVVQAGLATAAVLLGNVVCRLPAGALVDRWPRGRVMVLANVLAAACFGSLAVTALTGTLVLAQLIAVGFLSGVADAFLAPASSAAVRTVVPMEQLPVAYARLQIHRHTADLVGPPLGGALFSAARGLPFLADAVSYGLCAIAVTFVRTPLPAPTPAAERTSVVEDVVEGLRFVWRESVIRAVMLWGAAFNFAVTVAFVTITLRLVRAGVHPAAIGLVDTIAAAAALLGSFVAPVIIRRVRTGLVTFATGLVLALVIVPVAWTTNVAVIGALLAVGFFLLPANNSGISAYMVSVTPDRLQARVNAAGGFIVGAVLPAAPALAGFLVGSVGGAASTLIGAALVAASLAPLLSSSAVRRLGRPDQWAST
jgi:MFS family permease